MNDEGAGLGTAKRVSYAGIRIFLILFSLLFLAGGGSMTLTMGKGVLEKQDWFGAIFLIVPALFAVLGLCGLYGSVFLIPWHEKASASISDKASTTRESGATLVSVFGYAFFGIFLAAGLGALVSGCLVPLAQIAEAMTWPQLHCVILDAGVTQHKGDDSVTYRVSVRYGYNAGGKEMTSDRFAPIDKPINSWKTANAVLRQYPPGSETLCYVSPHDPTKSALTIGGFPGDLLVFGLMGFVFMSVGGAGIYFTATKTKQWREQQEARGKKASAQPETPRVTDRENERQRGAAEGWVLKPKETPLKKFLFTLFFTFVWNGFICIFAWLWWSGEHGSIPWWGKGMIGLFGLFGLLMIWGVVGAFLALFAPRPKIVVDRKQIRLGEPFKVSWRFTGSEQLVPAVNLYVEGIEEARSGAGSDMKTDTRTFLHIPITALSGSAQFIKGSQTVTIPANSMHSFNGDHNTIRWAMCLKAEIKGTRSMDETFEMQVGPVPAELMKRA